MRRVGLFLLLFFGILLRADVMLLTDNGVGNQANSAYEESPRLATGGHYVPSPAFSVEEAPAPPVLFGEGILTNGDASFDYRKRPLPYVYWQGSQYGQIVFDLGRSYRIRKIRVCLLNQGPHGTRDIELLAKGDPLEFPDALRMGRIDAVDGWNVFDELNRQADGVTLRFRLAKGKTYITMSEVEIWGEPLPETAGAETQAPRRPDRLPLRDDDGVWYGFDFGPPESPAFAHLVPASQDGVYSSDRGYGWVPQQQGEQGNRSNFQKESEAIPGLAQRDRAAKRGACGDSLYRDFVMTCAYYHTQVRQTFALDLQPGTYRVVTLHGDQVYGSPGPQSWWIEAENQRVVDRPEMPSSRMFDCVFDVAVSDGRLDLTFDSDAEDPAKRGFILNGLAVMPATTAAESAAADRRIERLRAAIERERQDLFEQTFTENPHVETRQMRDPTDEERPRGFVEFVPHWMANVYPNTVPAPEDEARDLACFACPGEYEPMKLAVRSLVDLQGVRCTVSALKGPGAVIPADAIEVRAVRCWPQRLGSSWSTEWRVMPELLEKRDAVDIPAETSQAFWLTLQVPEDAAPGLYTGTATVGAAGRPALSVPLRVEVLPFRLRDSERTVGMYWRDGRVEGNPELLRAQIEDMLAHGVSAVTMGQVFPEITKRDGRIELDTEPLLTMLQTLQRLGLRGPVPYHISTLMRTIRSVFSDCTDEEADALYIDAVRQLQAVSSRDDTAQLLFYPVDEIGNHADRGEKAHHECGLIAQVPGAVSYITVNNVEAGLKWGDTFDIWCGNIVYPPEQETALLDRGKRYMRYGSAYLNDPRKTRSSTGFGFYKRPAEAMYYWHYQAFAGDPFNDFDGTSRDWCAAYPGPDNTPIPTTDWEGIREGVDDLRYIATLNGLVAEAVAKPDAQAPATKAMAALAAVLNRDDELRQTAFSEALSDDEYHALRRRLVDAIISLKKAMAP